jgi:hypothetical protein
MRVNLLVGIALPNTEVVAMDLELTTELTDDELFQAYGLVMEEFRVRGLTRSSNNPVADYAELLVARHFGVEPVRGVQLGYDVLTPAEVRVQVKARRRGLRSKPTHYGWIHNLDDREFDKLAAVLFDANFRVLDADLLSWDAVNAFAKYNARVGAHRIRLVNAEMRLHPGVRRLELPV